LQDFLFPVLPNSIPKLPLDAARQLILPFGRDEGVFPGHLKIAVAGDF
jgi:hypothetical protein